MTKENNDAPLAPVAGLIPDGEYSMACVAVTVKQIYGEKRAVADFEFFPSHPSEFAGITLQWFAVLYPTKGLKQVRPGSKFYAAWCLANGKRRPNRGDRMSPKIFKGKLFRVKVETANRQESEFRQYSVVREILDIEAGVTIP